MRKAAIIFAYNYPEHLNKKNEGIKERIIKMDNCYFIKNNYEIEWGRDGFLYAIIESWKEVTSKKKYDWIILLSGQDLMINNGLDDFLNKHPNQIFIDSIVDDKNTRVRLLKKWPSKYLKRIDSKLNIIRILRRLRIELLKLGLPFFERSVNYDTSCITFYKSFFWSVIPEKVIIWILNYIKENPNYMEIFSGMVAEEGFIATTIMFSPYRNNLIFDENGFSHSLTFFENFVNNHPPLLKKNDIKKAESSGCFFARKIDPEESAEFIEYFIKKTRHII